MEEVVALILTGLGAWVAATLWLIVRVIGLSSRTRKMADRLAEVEVALARVQDRERARGQEEKATGVRPGESAVPEPVSQTPGTPVPEAVPTSAPPPLAPVVTVATAGPAPLPAGEPGSAPGALAVPPLIASTSPAIPEQPPSGEMADFGAAASSKTTKLRMPVIDWEQFMGVRLFAWIGGFALFLGLVFFVKYSFDNNLVPPELRVALGFLAGLGLVAGGAFLQRKDYRVTAQTLCATGVVVLYATTYACRSIYHFQFFQGVPSFALMALITTTAFLLAVRMQAQVVAILGMLGGFLTPVLLSTGVNNPVGLFTYIALLDAGLVAVAMHRRWHYLVPLAAAGTVFMQYGWAIEFFTAPQVGTSLVVFLGFAALFLAAFVTASRRGQSNTWITAASLTATASAFVFTLVLMAYPSVAAKPWWIFALLFGSDLCLLALVALDVKLDVVQLAAGAAAFLLLSVWTLGHLSADLLNWALAAYLLFAVLHSVFPLALARIRPAAAPMWWAHFFPPLALLLVMLPLFKFEGLTWLLWPCVLLIDVLAVGLALFTASLLAVLVVLVLTVLTTAMWLGRVPTTLLSMPEVLLVIGGFAVFFFVASLFAGRKVFGPAGEALRAGGTPPPRGLFVWGRMAPEDMRVQLPAFSAVLPFLLLVMVVAKLSPLNPSPVFGLGLFLIVLLLGVARHFRIGLLALVGLGCTLALEAFWHQIALRPEGATVGLIWYVVFYSVFTLFPFVFRETFSGRVWPWVAAALAGPGHFLLVHRLVKLAWPNDFMGLLPAVFAIPSILALVTLVRQLPPDQPKRMTLLAWFGGVALFFITLIFPIQFDRQWITLGWALEGVAVLWLFHRVPHQGLRYVGCALLAVAFARLALNPAVYAYQPRATTAIWNWYLYTYGLTTLCLLAGAWLLRPPRDKIGKLNVCAALTSLGALLLFLLINIEIADYFTPEGTRRLAFSFRGNFARDMTYSIAWALYALGLLVVGFWKQVKAARYAGLGLLSLTLLKLFIHDLSTLGQLYRIGAFVCVAAIAILASFLYQRHFARAAMPAPMQPPGSTPGPGESKT